MIHIIWSKSKIINIKFICIQNKNKVNSIQILIYCNFHKTCNSDFARTNPSVGIKIIFYHSVDKNDNTKPTQQHQLRRNPKTSLATTNNHQITSTESSHHKLQYSTNNIIMSLLLLHVKATFITANLGVLLQSRLRTHST